jgi:hypothetical protein
MRDEGIAVGGLGRMTGTWLWGKVWAFAWAPVSDPNVSRKAMRAWTRVGKMARQRDVMAERV